MDVTEHSSQPTAKSEQQTTAAASSGVVEPQAASEAPKLNHSQSLGSGSQTGEAASGPSNNAKKLVLELIQAVQHSTRHKHSSSLSASMLGSDKMVSMKYRNIGKNGLRVPLLAFSAWQNFAALPEERAEEVLTTAYENGINYFDTGDAFANGEAESMLGRILARKSWPRSSYIVSTKLFAKTGPTTHLGGGLSRKFIVEAVEASLRRLGLKYLDILIIHKLDAMCPMEEIVRTMSYLINNGIIFYWGTSRFAPMHLAEAFAISRQFNCPPPICEQMEYHMEVRDKMELQMLELFHKAGIGCITWSPISLQNDSGIAHISRRSYQIFQELAQRSGFTALKYDQLLKMCHSLGCDLTQLSLAWCLQNENVNCILVTASTSQEMIQKIQSIKLYTTLSQAINEQIEQILGNNPVLKRQALLAPKPSITVDMIEPMNE